MTKKILSLALFLILAAQLAYAEGIKKGSLIIENDFSFSNSILPTGEYMKIGAFKFTASPTADIFIGGLTLRLNKSSNVPNALFSNFVVVPADGTDQFYGISSGKGVNSNGVVSIEFDNPNKPFIVGAGTTKWVNVMVDIAPPGLTMQDAVSIGIYDVDSSAEKLIPGVPVYGPMLSGIGGNIVVYPDFSMINALPSINMKDNGKYVRFQVNFKHINAAGKKFVMKVTMNDVVVRNVTIPASYKFFAFDVLKTWMQKIGDAQEEGGPFSQYYLEVELDPDNQILELDDCNSVYLEFTMLPGNAPNWVGQSSACY